MAAPSLTYTLTNGTTADASQVMQNFTDLLNGITDGTKSLSILELTTAAGGTQTLNGTVILGNASSKDLTVTASLASSIPIKTTRSYDIGSADLGLRTLYLGGNDAHTVALSAPSSGYSGDVTFSLPTGNGTSNYVLKTDGSGVTSWAALETVIDALTITSLSNADATKLGLKEYLHGTTYNGSVAPTVSYVSGGGSISTVNRGVFVPYQMQSGTWRMRFNINVTVSSTSRSSLKIEVNGITTQASVDQTFSGSVYTAAGLINSANTTNNTNDFEISHATATATIYGYAGDIELASKPTWAY